MQTDSEPRTATAVVGRLRWVADGSPNAIVVVDEAGKIVLINNKTEKLFGYSPEELVGETVETLLPEDFCEDHVKHRASFSSEPNPRRMAVERELSACHKDGSQLAVRIGLSAYQAKDELLVLASIVDASEGNGKGCVAAPYGNLVELNTKRLVLDSVGEDVLAEIASDFLDLLQTSAAVYEANGDYAMGLVSSEWCRFLDTTSRNRCDTDDNTLAIQCDKWHCHQSCWEVSRAAIETGLPADAECRGGLRILAVPILAHREVVGAINVGYGNPPDDPKELQRIAERYGVSVDELREKAEAYEPRAPAIIETAKRRLHASARLIGTLVERKQTEERLLMWESALARTNRIVEIFLTVPDDEMYAEVLDVIIEAMDSLYGVFGFLDENGDLIVPSITRHIWDRCQVSDKDIVFPRATWGDSTWPRAIRERRAICSNDPSTDIPEGHVAIARHISLPILFREEPIGLFQVANKQTPYEEKDVELLQSIADQVAPILYARLQRNRENKRRKRIETELRRMSKVFQDGADPIIIEDLSGRVMEMNAEAERAYGWSREELVGQPIKTIMPPERHQQADELRDRCGRGEDIRNVESLQCTKLGQVLPVLLTLSYLTDEAGEPAAIATIAKDTRESKKAHQEALAATRLATIGQLVGTVAHELRNPLSAVGNAVFYLKRKVPDTEPKWKEYLRIISHEVAVSEQIIRNLLEVTRAKEPAPEALDLGPLVREVFAPFGIPEGIQWEFTCQPDPYMMVVDRVQLKQVLRNLLQNALQSVGDKGNIRLDARRTPKHQIIVFHDDGAGVAPQHRERVFEPLFSTKAKGTGLGLWISREIIERHGGTIRLVDDQGAGAAFRIELPR